MCPPSLTGEVEHHFRSLLPILISSSVTWLFTSCDHFSYLLLVFFNMISQSSGCDSLSVYLGKSWPTLLFDFLTLVTGLLKFEMWFYWVHQSLNLWSLFFGSYGRNFQMPFFIYYVSICICLSLCPQIKTSFISVQLLKLFFLFSFIVLI